MEKSKAVVFVPHQDDEVNLVGNCIDRLLESYEIYIVFSSMDTNRKMAQMRKKEAIKSCKILGVPQNKVLFLDYPDTPNRLKKHYFTDGDTRIVCDIINILRRYSPSLIIGTDFDYHSDHKMLSLALEEAIGVVVSEKHQLYKPLVLKGFCYETAFCGVKDYFQSKNGRCVSQGELLGNPSYIWNKRVSLFGNEKERFIWKKKAFRALLAHKSQYAVLRAESVLNKDNVYWIRRTDNLLLNDRVKISASSGNTHLINDFMFLQTDDISPIRFCEHDFSKAVWKPDANDLERYLYIQLEQIHLIEKIVFRGNPSSENYMPVDGEIQIGATVIRLSEIMPYARETVVQLNGIKTDSIIIRFKSYVEISEVEVFESNEPNCLVNEIGELFQPVVQPKEMFWIGRLYYLFICLYYKIKRKIFPIK